MKTGLLRRTMTLIEIMVVITIIASLMAVLAVTVMGQFQQANQGTTITTMKVLEGALQSYSLKHKGKYPSTSDGLDKLKKYMADGDIPKDAWDNEFLYFSPGSHSEKAYELMSLGADAKEGGEDWDQDIKSWALDELE